MWAFYKALFKNPRSIGAVFPSSSYLARAIAAFIPNPIPGLVVELGPGTGVITQALLANGIAPERLIAVEYSKDMVDRLRERFPHIHIIHGNAEELSFLLEKENMPISAIVSSLPFMILPANEKNRLIAQIEKLLPRGGYYIQYTYTFHKNPFEFKKNFQKIASKRIFRNLPPARVDVFVVV